MSKSNNETTFLMNSEKSTLTSVGQQMRDIKKREAPKITKINEINL